MMMSVAWLTTTRTGTTSLSQLQLCVAGHVQVQFVINDDVSGMVDNNKNRDYEP